MKKRIIIYLLLLGIILLFISCENVFTYNTLSSLQRDPEDLTDTQKIEYARHALESGDQELMEKAFEALDDILEDDPENGEVWYLAAKLSLELSGVPQVIWNIIEGKPGAPQTATELFSSSSVDQDYYLSAYFCFLFATENDIEINPMEYIIIGIKTLDMYGMDAKDLSADDIALAKILINTGFAQLPSEIVDPINEFLEASNPYW